MKTALIKRTGEPDVLEIVTSDRPSPGPHEVLIRTAVMAVSGPDVLMRRGLYKWSPPLPLSPGNELVGFVESVGEQVQQIKVGSAVLLSARELPARGGCYTEYRVVPANAVHVLPEGVDLEQAVTIPTYVVAHAMLRGSLNSFAKSIFVNGIAGTMGGALTELAKAQGLTVIGTVSSEEKAHYARSKGADEVIIYNKEAVLERVMELTNGRGVDVAFDHVIGARFVDCIRMLADFGTAVAYDVHTPMPDQDIFAELRRLSSKTPALRVFNIHTYDHYVPLLRELTRELIEMLVAGKINPTIGARLTLDQVVEAHTMFERRDTVGKIVLIP